MSATADHSARVFTGLRWALAAVVTVLVAVTVALALNAAQSRAGAVVPLAVALWTVFAAGLWRARPDEAGGFGVPAGHARAWLLVLTLLVFALAGFEAVASYLAFPLYFLYLYLLPPRWGAAAVGVVAVAAVGVFVAHNGYSVGGILGPLLAAVAAVGLHAGYSTLLRETRERERLLREMVRMQHRLAESERRAGVAAGVMSERTRLAHEIHDTIAQNLSSIQMLLHAAERTADPARALRQVGLARDAAAMGLREARAFINELAPPQLDQDRLPSALAGLARKVEDESGLSVACVVEGDPVALPPAVDGALLRCAQGSLANVVQHARASSARVSLRYTPGEVGIVVADDGRGFPGDTGPSASDPREGGSFGIRALRERAAALGGRVQVDTGTRGTTVALTVPLDAGNHSTRKEPS